MAEIKALRDELERIRAKVKAALDANPNGLTTEQNLEVSALMTKATELQTELKTEQVLEEKKRDLAQLDDFLNTPQYRVPHGVGEGEDDTHKALRAGGWEVKGGMIYAPTSTGKMLPMYTEDVLFGEIPSDGGIEVENFYKSTRRAFQPDYRKSYERMLRLIGKYHGEYSMMWTRLTADEQKALSEGTDTAGGFLVPPDIQAEMLVRLPQKAAIRAAGARVQPTSRDILKYPMAQAAAATAGGLATGGGSIFSSGFIGSWAGETPAFTDVDASFGSFDVPVKKLRVATKLSNDFLADAMVNVLAFLASNGADNMALVEDQGFLTGDGSALQPLGILNAPGLVTVDVEGSTVNFFGNTTSNIGSATKLIDLEYALPSQYIPGAQWLMRRSIEGKVRKLVDANGRFLWPLMGGFQAPATREIDSYPVRNSEFMPADGTDANKIILFGEFGSYIIAQRAQITSTILRERFADTDQTGIILWERVGGATWNPDGFRVGIV